MTVNPSGLHGRGAVLKALEQVEGEWALCANDLPLETFFREPAPGRWSPALHLRHLTLTHGRVAVGLRTPRPVVRTLFGSPQTARSYQELREAYRAALAAGGKAPARYIPRPDPRTGAETRVAVLRDYAQAAQNLRAALERWSESALDAHALPHDLLGKISVREMVFFTLYHDHHHLDGVRATLGKK
ncbi:DinB family protein [Deinococcus hopiensis]|uniref:DinB superfamily protein n=1 Tax=Deinococcus hopiensis KR-140 TaxID=695939 RepID=A0A1W1VPD9_9DEIO|nr:DinB family protein [Deinococcus hopiensis]SMB95100.1 DinB superfamily protein [Deinococcus hopiensis KR-140]